MINVITDERRDQKKFPKLMQSTLTGIYMAYSETGRKNIITKAKTPMEETNG